MAEVEVPLLNCLHELSCVSLTLGGKLTGMCGYLLTHRVLAAVSSCTCPSCLAARSTACPAHPICRLQTEACTVPEVAVSCRRQAVTGLDTHLPERAPAPVAGHHQGREPPRASPQGGLRWHHDQAGTPSVPIHPGFLCPAVPHSLCLTVLCLCMQPGCSFKALFPAACGCLALAAEPGARHLTHAEGQLTQDMRRFGPALRRAKVAQVEIRLRVLDGSGAWRMLVSSPSGAPRPAACVCSSAGLLQQAASRKPRLRCALSLFSALHAAALASWR